MLPKCIVVGTALALLGVQTISAALFTTVSSDELALSGFYARIHPLIARGSKNAGWKKNSARHKKKRQYTDSTSVTTSSDSSTSDSCDSDSCELDSSDSSSYSTSESSESRPRKTARTPVWKIEKALKKYDGGSREILKDLARRSSSGKEGKHAWDSYDGTRPVKMSAGRGADTTSSTLLPKVSGRVPVQPRKSKRAPFLAKL